MNAITVDLVDLVADRAKSLGPHDRQELAEAIVQRLGVSVAVGAAVGSSQPAVGTKWAIRAQQLREHPMRLTPLPDADWDAFRDDMKTVREDVLGS
jgi:hypothetical protein